MNITKLKFISKDITKCIASFWKQPFSTTSERFNDKSLNEQNFSNTKKEKKVDWSILFKEDFSFEIKSFKENSFCNKTFNVLIPPELCIRLQS